jgi:transcriptional regulator with XRE-family HTH domain
LEDTYLNLGEKLKKLRKERNMKQEELAFILNVDRTTVSNWERGEKQPGIDILIKLRSIYSVTLDEIVGFKNDHPGIDIDLASLTADPLVKLLSEKTGVPPGTISAFIVALKIDQKNNIY